MSVLLSAMLLETRKASTYISIMLYTFVEDLVFETNASLATYVATLFVIRR